jgi:hypothetical protein
MVRMSAGDEVHSRDAGSLNEFIQAALEPRLTLMTAVPLMFV